MAFLKLRVGVTQKQGVPCLRLLRGTVSPMQSHVARGVFSGYFFAGVHPSDLMPAAVPMPKQHYRYLDIKADELRGTFKSSVESEQRLLYYGQLDRTRFINLETPSPQVTHHRQVSTEVPGLALSQRPHR